MDRDRLKEVHATDLTESKVNEDFVDWLKQSGPTWLMFILIAVCVFLGVTRWRQGQASKQANAWGELATAQLPSSLEDVAAEYVGVGQVSNLARLQAAEALLSCVQRGVVIDAGAAAPTTTAPEDSGQPSGGDILSSQEREEYLARAKRLFDEVLTSVGEESGTSLLQTNAMFGLAAVAEGSGDAATARSWYEKAATAADAGSFPGLAAQARARAENVDAFAGSVTLLSQDEIGQTQRTELKRTPISLDPSLSELIMPADDEATGG